MSKISIKNKIFISFCLLHISIILAVSIQSTINSYCDFYHYSKPKGYLASGLNTVLGYSFVKRYSFLTAAETGYGYFAPNVLSSGFLKFESGKKQYKIIFSNYESKHRFSDLCSRFISRQVQPNRALDSIKLDAQYKQYGTYNKMDSLYYDLILKSICAHIFNVQKDIDTINVTLEVYDFPKLKDFRRNPNLMAHLFPLYEKNYFFRN